MLMTSAQMTPAEANPPARSLRRSAGDFDFQALRDREFARLDAQRHAYLDYTGSALYGVSQLRAHLALLESGLFGNPHSQSHTSAASTAIVEQARTAVMDFLGVDARSHVVCFTGNCSAAIKLVAESYPFDAQRGLLLTTDNHNSINGVREYARAAGAAVRVIGLDVELRLHDPEAGLREAATAGGGLFAFPAQSNFSGVRHPLKLADKAHELGLDVLLDIAAYASSEAISLRRVPADFAVLSFYKLFGYPTGLGALILRKEALAKLRRPWFAGGTVRYASVHANQHRLHDGAEGFEDGTPDFLGLAALPAGFALLAEAGMDRLSARLRDLTGDLLQRMRRLCHKNGSPLLHLYGPPDLRERGATVSFNVLDGCGDPADYTRIEASAADAGISLRGGCFCNPGAAEAAFGLAAERLAECLQSVGDDFTPRRLADCAGTAVGAIRVSLGLASNRTDLDRLIQWLESLAAGTA